MTRIKPDLETFAKIKVVGIGGGGSNAVTRMVTSRMKGVDFITVNTDAQDLHHSQAHSKLHIGKSITRGLGAGMNPELGRQAAEESREEIQEALKGADLVFITSGMGGGTGSGASAVVADVARALGALTIAVITKPFTFEGAQRSKIAEEAIANLKDAVDTLVVIPNDRIFNIIGEDTSLVNSFEMVDDILKQAVFGIADLITLPGIINVDFNDVKAIMQDAGSALMGIGIASGEDRAAKAAKAAINSPLLELSIEGARGVLFNVSGGQDDLKMMEINTAAKVITEFVDAGAKIIFGAVHDPRLKKGEIKITVIATGFGDGVRERPAKKDIFTRPVSTPHSFETNQAKKENVAPSAEILSGQGNSATNQGNKTVKPVVSVNPENSYQDKKVEQKSKIFTPEVTKISDDGWDIPAFIRRRK